MLPSLHMTWRINFKFEFIVSILEGKKTVYFYKNRGTRWVDKHINQRTKRTPRRFVRAHEQRAHELRDAGRVSLRCYLVSAREISNGRCASAKLESRRFCRIELELLGGKNDHFAVWRWVALPAPHPVPPMPRCQETVIRFGGKQIKGEPNKRPTGS